MKKVFAALAGLIGLAWWRNRSKPAPALQPDPADELRAKLAEARDSDDRDDFEARETPVDQVPDEAGSVGGQAADARQENRAASGGDGDIEARRRAVHERARHAADDLRSEE